MELLKALTEPEQKYLEELLSHPTKRLAEHSDIELTEDEIADALTKAKSAKVLRLKYEENIELRRKQSDEIIKPFAPGQLVEYAQKFYSSRFDKTLEIDSDNKILIEKLSQYFTSTESQGFSLNKGILLMGNVGTGKTELMKFFQKNKKACYKIISCNTVAEDYLILDKDDFLNAYSNPIEKPLHDPAVFFQKYIGICFDDLGTEENKNSFGNKKNVMEEVLLAVYNSKNFSMFHLTTNLNPDEIEARYGTRVRSRLKEMFNVFILNGNDRRKS